MWRLSRFVCRARPVWNLWGEGAIAPPGVDDRGDPHAHGDRGDNLDRAVLEDLSAGQMQWDVACADRALIAAWSRRWSCSQSRREEWKA